MEKGQVAICDDETILLPQLSSIVKAAFRRCDRNVETKTYESGAKLLEALRRQERFLAFFLDIDMPEQDGIQVARRIREQDPEARILFLSAREDLVFDTFALRPLAFIRKSRFSKDMETAMGTLMEVLEKPKEVILPMEDDLGHFVDLHVDRIVYIESRKAYQEIHSLDGVSLIRKPIQFLEELLSPYRFIRIHRGILVNYRYIHRALPDTIVLDDGGELPISRQRKKQVKEQFLEYARPGE